ncbi:histidinol dehydrogenase [Chloroflexota bacterium]
MALARLPLPDSSAVSLALRERLKEIFGVEIDPEQAVKQIISEVRERGDAAIFDYTMRIDRVELTTLQVDRQQITRAYQRVKEELIAALKLAAERIRSFHAMQYRDIQSRVGRPDVGWMIRPLQRVGIYVPGGTACYPSTALMTAIPAKVAGVDEVIMVTPPGPDGEVPAPTLVAADIAGVDHIYCVGGIQAIAALAFGTESVPRVDKICGPGNIFVVLAKKAVYGTVDIDGLQGPSEVLIIADDTADPKYCAADLLAQAEHDPLASSIMITTSQQLAHEVNREVERQAATLSHQAVITESLGNRGMIAVVSTVDEAIELANLYAPEHLCLMVDRAAAYINQVDNAGAVFIGNDSAVALGDYVAGPSHTLPTGGTARFSSPLSVDSFTKMINLVNISRSNLSQLSQAAIVIAGVEGFDAHVKALEKRLKKPL